MFDSSRKAAEAYDDAVLRFAQSGNLPSMVNFPRAGTDDAQAVVDKDWYNLLVAKGIKRPPQTPAHRPRKLRKSVMMDNIKLAGSVLCQYLLLFIIWCSVMMLTWHDCP